MNDMVRRPLSSLTNPKMMGGQPLGIFLIFIRVALFSIDLCCRLTFILVYKLLHYCRKEIYALKVKG